MSWDMGLESVEIVDLSQFNIQPTITIHLKRDNPILQP